jgi:alkylated DNA repair protein alkB family protein 7
MLVEAALKKLKRALGKQVRYEDGHFDGVITRYRECSATDWGADSGAGAGAATTTTGSRTGSAGRAERSTPQEVMQSIKQEFFPHHWKWVAPHILELEAGKGGIKPHVDHLEASGEVVAGLCLGSTAVMELVHENNPNQSFRVLLPKGCFYFQRDSVRYHYKHGIPILPEDHQFKGTVIPKERRISVMLRVGDEQRAWIAIGTRQLSPANLNLFSLIERTGVSPIGQLRWIHHVDPSSTQHPSHNTIMHLTRPTFVATLDEQVFQ